MSAPLAELAFLPLFPGPAGLRFVVHHVPSGPVLGLVVFVHALAEEMNKSRRMSALQAEAFSSAGWAVLRIDLDGCGDSPGDFSDATWEQWVADVVAAAAWLRQRHRTAAQSPLPLYLWGHRSGCLLASAVVHQGLVCAGLLLWQPPVSGQVILRHFVRLRVAAQIASNARTAADDIQSELTRDGVAYVAGYGLSRALAHALGAALLQAPPSGVAVHWFEVSSALEPALLPASLATVQAWRERGVAVHDRSVLGPMFWLATEVECAPALLEASTRALAGTSLAAPAPSVRLEAPSSAVVLPSQDVVERALAIGCNGPAMSGVLTLPLASPMLDTAVVIVVGGPQYRVGSHRQFVDLSRSLAAAGWPVLRFDVRGMGDSGGEFTGFEHLTNDIAEAIDAVAASAPTVRGIALWGLCDGASAALLYLHKTRDPRVHGLCLVNPWVRTPKSLAQVQVKHYYAARLRSHAFWAKLASGAVGLRALKDLWRNLRLAARARPAAARAGSPAADFRDRMSEALTAFGGDTLLVLSGRDLVAREFENHIASDPRWRPAPGRMRLERIADADHTFSRRADATKLVAVCTDWLDQLAPGHLPRSSFFHSGEANLAAQHP